MWKGQNIAVSLYKIIYFDTIQYDKNNLFTPFFNFGRDRKSWHPLDTLLDTDKT